MPAGATPAGAMPAGATRVGEATPKWGILGCWTKIFDLFELDKEVGDFC